MIEGEENGSTDEEVKQINEILYVKLNKTSSAGVHGVRLLHCHLLILIFDDFFTLKNSHIRRSKKNTRQTDRRTAKPTRALVEVASENGGET